MDTKVTGFEDLRIWQEARQLIGEIYRDIPNGAGANDFGFQNQIRRAGVSIMNNIAEGFERTTDADFARFLDIAKGSSGEVRSMYYLAEDLSYVSPHITQERRAAAVKISKGISSLAAHLRLKPKP